MTEVSRLKGLFFAYFAYVGILSPYLSLYFSVQGFSVAQIGLLMTVPNVLRIVAPPFWGWLADRSGRADNLLRISTVLTVSCVLLLPLASTTGYAASIALLGLMFFVSAAQVPIGEARTQRLIRGDSGRYGRIRLWGSIGFIGAVALGGPALDLAGTRTLPGWASLPLLLLLAVVWRAGPVGPSAGRGSGNSLWRSLRQPLVAAFFAANFLMIFSHAALYVLFSLYLEKHGYSKTMIGLLWSVGVVAEIILFRFQRPLFERFSGLTLMTASLWVAAVRFALVGVSGGLLPLLLLTQVMHMVTFGLHHSAVMRVLHEWFDDSRQARAQAMYVTIAYGCGGTAGGLALTAAWDQVSAATAFFVAALAAGIGAVLAAYCCRQQRLFPVNQPGAG